MTLKIVVVVATPTPRDSSAMVVKLSRLLSNLRPCRKSPSKPIMRFSENSG